MNLDTRYEIEHGLNKGPSFKAIASLIVKDCTTISNEPDDNPSIGIILCTDKTNVEAEYALGGLSNNIFASRDVLFIPDKEQLIKRVEAVFEK